VACLTPPAICKKGFGPCRGLDGLKGLH
jgi:hypothetical protein